MMSKSYKYNSMSSIAVFTVLVFLAAYFQLTHAFTNHAFVCGLGEQFIEGNGTHSDICIRCPRGYFQNETHHRYKSCNKCSIFDKYAHRKILLDRCTRFHDIVVRCRPGFYFNEHGDCFACAPCATDGKFEGQACTNYSNTICCEKESQMVKNGVCVEPEDFCQPDEFLVEGNVCRNCKECERCQQEPRVEQNCSIKVDDFEKPNEKTNSDTSTSKINTFMIGIAIVIGIVSYCFGVLTEKVFAIIKKCKTLLNWLIDKLWPMPSNQTHTQVPQSESITR